MVLLFKKTRFSLPPIWKSNLLFRNTPSVPRKFQTLVKGIQISGEGKKTNVFLRGKLPICLGILVFRIFNSKVGPWKVSERMNAMSKQKGTHMKDEVTHVSATAAPSSFGPGGVTRPAEAQKVESYI